MGVWEHGFRFFIYFNKAILIYRFKKSSILYKYNMRGVGGETTLRKCSLHSFATLFNKNILAY